MPDHQDWFSIILGQRWETATEYLQHQLSPGWISGGHPELHHVAGALFVLVISVILAVMAVMAKRRSENPLIPDKSLTSRNFFELICEMLLAQMEQQMDKERARKFLPIIASFTLFILFSNALGLVPGFLPPTDKLNTTVPLALTAFVVYHVYGLLANGTTYLAHFCGPLLPKLSQPKTWPALLLAVLMLIIEVFSHLARVLSLSVRLMVNLFADHLMLTIFSSLFAILVPLPILVLGVLVTVIQTVVFVLLSIIYISLATEDMHHGHDDGHDGEHSHEDEHTAVPVGSH